MINRSNLGKKSVDLESPARASRIRRDPVRPANEDILARDAWWDSREWEVRLAIAGIVFFAVAISAMVVDLGALIGR